MTHPAPQPSETPEPMPWAYALSAGTSAREQPVPRVQVVQALVVTFVAFAFVGMVAAFAWNAIADPPGFLVAKTSAYMDEEAAGGQFGIVVTYSWIAALLSLVVGAVLSVCYHRLGWPVVVGIALAAGLAALIEWKLGLLLGPPDPRDVLPTAALGDRVPIRLDLDAFGVLLLWPIGALAAMLGVVGLARESAPSPER